MPTRKKVAQHKSFAGKQFYIIVGIVTGYLLAIPHSPKQTFHVVMDYMNENVWLGTLVTALFVSLATSYFKVFWSKRESDR